MVREQAGRAGGVPDPVLARLAARHGLIDPGTRQATLGYLREVWARRAFIVAFSRARMTASYSGTRLGRWWQVLSPLLNAAVFFLVFGVVLKAKHGIPDYVPFLVTGVFTWAFLQGSVTAGVRSITANLGLVRTLHFPRASLPLALCLRGEQEYGRG